MGFRIVPAKISKIYLYHVNLGKTLQIHYYDNHSPISIVLLSESTKPSFCRCLYKAGGKINMVQNSGNQESHLTIETSGRGATKEYLIQIDRRSSC